jgi:hypothetical protein
VRVLVACEFSGIVREAFRVRGHDAWSCDLLPTEIPGNHIQGDVLSVLGDGWDLMVAHPPCTVLCRNSSKWNANSNSDEIVRSKELFFRLISSNIPKICVENPVPRKVLNLPQYDQIIQPWQFGHDYSKKTCLWLKCLPPLKSTNVVQITYYTTPKGHRFTAGWYKTPRNGKDRSRTFFGIAEAMADQWGGLE